MRGKDLPYGGNPLYNGHKPQPQKSRPSGTSPGSDMRICAKQDCAPPYGDKEDCELNERGACMGKTPLTYYDTIAVDFDGTLCENNFPDIGEPKPLVIEYIKRQAAADAKIILHTCRENGTRRALLDEAVEFCAVHGIPLYAVNENPANIFTEQYGTGTGRKVYADLYIDDKAVNVADVETLMTARKEGKKHNDYF